MVDAQEFYLSRKGREKSRRWIVGVSLQLLCKSSALDLDMVLSPCYPFRDQKKLGECVHRGMDLISHLLRSLSASCDSRFVNMHSDKQVAWPGSVWEHGDSNLSSHDSGEWKKWSLWEFHAWFFFDSCAVSWLALKLWIKRADPSNLYKSESYRRVVSVTGVGGVDCEKEIYSFKK